MITPSSAIQALRLSRNLDGHRVLREIDLEIASGECVALMGGNGAGKTTLLRCLAGIVRPTSGEVRWFGRPANEVPEQRQLVGIVAHETGLYGHLTLRENLLFAARMRMLSDRARLVDHQLEQIGLRKMAGRPVRQLSKGMRQRLALARTLIYDPPILLLDEPFTGLDATSRDWLLGMLCEQRARGRAICFATHDAEHSRQLADRAMFLENGRLEKSREGALAGHALAPHESAELGAWRDAA